MVYVIGHFSRSFCVAQTNPFLHSILNAILSLSLSFCLTDVTAANSFSFFAAQNPGSIWERGKCESISSMLSFASCAVKVASSKTDCFMKRWHNPRTIMSRSPQRKGTIGLSVWYLTRNWSNCLATDSKNIRRAGISESAQPDFTVVNAFPPGTLYFFGYLVMVSTYFRT